MPTIDDKDLFLAEIDRRGAKPSGIPGALGAAGRYAGGFLEKAVPAAGQSLLGVLQSLDTRPEALARRSGEMIAGAAGQTVQQPYGPTAIAPPPFGPRTPEEAIAPKSTGQAMMNQLLMGVPDIIEGAAESFGTMADIQPAPGGGVTSTPLPFPAEARGGMAGQAVGEAAPFILPGIVSRFRPGRPTGVAPRPTGAVPADFEVVPQAQLGTGEIAPPAPKAAPTGPIPMGPRAGMAAQEGLTGGAQAPRQLPRGTAEMTRSKVLPGFTPVKSSYKVESKSVGAKGFNQFRNVEAFSEAEAVQKVKDELNQVQPGISEAYEFRASSVKGTQKPVPQAEASRLAEGRPTEAETPPERSGVRRMEKTVEAMKREEALQEKAPSTPRLRKPIRLYSTIEEGRGLEGREEGGRVEAPRQPAAEPAPPASEPTVKKGDAIDYPGIGKGTVTRTYYAEVGGKKRLALDIRQENGKVRKGLLAERAKKAEAAPDLLSAVTETERVGAKSSKVVREPTAAEAETMQPGEVRHPREGEIVARLSTEAERRVADRRGTGGGATSFGEERGPEAPERRATPGRRITDKEVKAAGSEGERRLAEIAAADSHAKLVGVYRKQHKAEPPPGIATKALREILNREAGSLTKGAKQALEPDLKAELAKEGMKPTPPEKPGPKGGAAAEAASPVDTARREAAEVPSPAGRGGLEVRGGRAATVKTPSQDFDVEYVEVPIESLKPSHNPLNFEPNREYPVEQQRDYTRNKIEQDKVIRMARNFNPDYILSDTPTSTDGPPIVSPEGHVLGGNARTMALIRGISEGTIKPGEIQAAVRAAGAKFGIEGAGSKPGTVIVRRTSPIERERISAATKALNEDFKMAVDPISDAVARARNLSAETVDWVSGVLNDAGPDATVRSAIFDDRAKLAALMKKLAEDQVVVSSEMPTLIDPNSKLTPEGIRMIEAAIVGRVIRSPKMIREMSAGLKNQVSNAISPWVRGETFPSEWRLNNDLVNGLWLHHIAEKAGKSIDMMIEPQLIPDPFLEAVKDNKVAIAIARWFEDHAGKPNALRAALSKFNAHAEESVGGQGALGFFEQKTPHAAANEAFGLKLTPDDYGTGDGIVYLHAGIDLGMVFEKIGFRLSKKAKQLRDVIFIPKGSRQVYIPGESFSEMLKRVRQQNTGDRFRMAFAGAWERLARFTVTNTETRRYPYFHEQLDQWNVHAMTQLERAANDMAEVVHPMLYFEDRVTGAIRRRTQKEIDFAADRWMTLVVLRDMVKRAELGLKMPFEDFPGFEGISKAQKLAAVKEELAAAEKNTGQAVKQSVEKWIKLFQETRAEMVRRGKLSKEDRIGYEYMPNIFHDVPWRTEKFTASAGPARIREAARGYTKQSVGHARLHDVNPVRAGLQHLTNVYLDNLLDDFAHSVGQAWDHWPQLWKEIRKQAKERGVEPDVIAKEIGIPDEFEVYQVGGKRKFMWDPATVNEFIVQKVVAQDPDIGLRIKTAADMRDFLLAELGDAPGSLRNPANRPAYLIPKAIAGTLKQFREPRGELEALVSTMSRGMTIWKGLQLLSIWVPYSMRNVLGDFHNLVYRLPGRGPVPGLAPLARHVPKATAEMVRSATKGITSEMLQKADQYGVRQNTRAVAEMSDLRVHKELREFLRPRRAKILQPLQKGYEALTDALANLMVFDSVREGTMRYAAWKYLVEDLKFPEKRAETLTSEIVGNYRVVDRMTKLMRRSGMMPFPVWIRQQIPGWFRWVSGAKLGRYFERPELYEADLSLKTKLEVRRRAEVRGISFEEALESLRDEAAIAPPNVPRPSAEPPPGVRPQDWQYAQSGRYPRGTASAILGAIVVPQLMLYWWNNVENKEKNARIDANFKKRYAYMILPGVETYDGRPAVLAVQSGFDATLAFFGFGDPSARAKKFHDAIAGGPAEVAKVGMEQIGETAATTAASVGDLFGPPLEISKELLETPFQVAKENMKPEEKRDWGRLLNRKYRRLYGELVPDIVAEPVSRVPGAEAVGVQKGRWTKAARRTDLEGIPDWMQGVMAQYPWGGLLYVPIAPSEKKRRQQESRQGAQR